VLILDAAWTSRDTSLVHYTKYFGVSVVDTIRTWSTMETIISVTGLVLVLLASLVV
jgi:Gnt-I system high-affinity gluconate transporter